VPGVPRPKGKGSAESMLWIFTFPSTFTDWLWPEDAAVTPSKSMVADPLAFIPETNALIEKSNCALERLMLFPSIDA
jgi:hypothetical protein